ncbi:MotA/TolQ/ExbB proton channel family protein [Methylovorus menthalis]|jgi:biopolymer transport protein ExbB|uniref:MotA/TolQ/ExbB proton channel family protein n=1 Tax=Methylovorus menthalis TaxID=1002227 RepID=UPI001E461F13|nr:MotA/TolQ/ExbB proton channel family protein [Methylovorus menthalis]MCB4811416.1 MotA/TolQ/ExbB proton channel family protein [Methylovorus menthalis]
MQSGYEFNGLAFITDGGVVSITVALCLLVMSVASWYLIIVKGIQSLRLRAASRNYSQRFWDASSLEVAIRENGVSTPMSRLANQAVEAAEHHQRHASKRLADACNQDEFVARSMRRVISDEGARLENGLTILASVGSVAPFVGLFGTVWGIYHALASISMSGQATLDKVAGPVGEALIMTAFGLAVAIPAVLAYNALVRSNRVLMAQLDSFANDLHVLLTTGAPLTHGNTPGESALKPQSHLKEVTA